MANIILGGKRVNTIGELPSVGSKAPNFNLTASKGLSNKSLEDFKGYKLVLNIFPSIDTPVCAQSVRIFNESASKLEKTKVLCISKDLPFAIERFCGAEGLDNVESLTDYKTGEFGRTYGVTFIDGAFESLLSRAIVVIGEDGTVVHTEQVPGTGDEPNYQAALKALN